MRLRLQSIFFTDSVRNYLVSCAAIIGGMGWTVAFLVLLVGGLIAVAVARLPPSRRARSAWMARSHVRGPSAMRHIAAYQMVQNVGFVVAAVGAIGLLGRYTGVLRR